MTISSTLDAASAPEQRTDTSPTAARIMSRALLGGALAGGLNLLVYALAQAASVSFVARYDPAAPATPLPLPFVVVASIVPAIAAGVFFIGLRKLTRHARVIFLAAAVLFTLVSVAGPANLAEATTGAKVALNVMHVVAGAVISAFILRRRRG